MSAEPPSGLVALLEETGLAAAGQVRAAAGRARRLAGDLPLLESVWVDALAQARVLSAFQAAEIHAGRGRGLRVGPFLLVEAVPWPEYARSFRARRVDGGEVVRLAVTASPPECRAGLISELENLAAASKRLRLRQLAPITEVGAEGERVWAASPWAPGRSAADWMRAHGRFPPAAVARIAREMLAGLEALDRAGLCHGDLSTAGMMLTEEGGVRLLNPGLRAIVRPAEGYAFSDLRPEAYDYLAPERVAAGSPPDLASDLYACGCVWWHLLCGRPPLAGGDSLTKLRSAGMTDVPDVRTFAPDTPAELAEAIAACVARDSGERPESPEELRSRLAAADRGGQTVLVRCLASRRGAAAADGPRPLRTLRRLSRHPGWPMAAAVTVVALLGMWSLWRDARPLGAPAGAEYAQQARQSEIPPPSELAAAETADRPYSGGVQPASYEAPVSAETPPDAANQVDGAALRPTHSDAVPSPSGPPERFLPGDGPVTLQSLGLEPGQRMCGPPDGMAVVLAPAGGLVVDREDVAFERIEFVGRGAAGQPSALLEIRASRATFRHCTFRPDSGGSAAVAIRWAESPDAASGDLDLPSGRLRLEDCAFYGMTAAVDARRAGALAIEMSNVLHLASGPLLRLDHCPAPDEPIRVVLRHATLRDCGPLLDCRYERAPDSAGGVLIDAVRCVLAPRSSTALLRFDGPQPPDDLLRNLQWGGQGSLLVPDSPFAAWRGPDRRDRPLDDAGFAISGLVRGRVEFAGPTSNEPADSRATDWQIPLATPDEPGINPRRLPPPQASPRSSGKAG